MRGWFGWLLEPFTELLAWARSIAITIRCRGVWCQACRLGSIYVAHTCPRKAYTSTYIDDDDRRVEFGRIVGAVEGMPRMRPVARPRRPKLVSGPGAEAEATTGNGAGQPRVVKNLIRGA